VKYDIKKHTGEGSKKSGVFRIYSNLRYYQFKRDCYIHKMFYVSLRGITKKKLIAQNKRSTESKQNTKENIQITREEMN